MARILVIRLSALGDVAMLVPVLYAAARHYPDDEFVLLTKSPLLPIFEHRPENVDVIPVYAKAEHKGMKGLRKLVRQLSGKQIDAVADTHAVLRSRIISLYFRLKGKRVAIIDKGRKEKKALTRQHHKVFAPLKTSIERYQDVFRQLGYDFPLDFQSIFEYGEKNFSLIAPVTGEKKGTWIGIAPFAKHQGKLYPLEKTEEVLRMLADKPQTKIFLFGGKEEAPFLQEWARRYPSAVCIAGQFTFSSELLLMSYLDSMITMDSGNMHLASLVGTPVISVWGATHPYAGFYGYRQDPENAVQTDLFCRPCSVFGDKACYRSDHPYECMHSITPERIVEKAWKYATINKLGQ